MMKFFKKILILGILIAIVYIINMNVTKENVLKNENQLEIGKENVLKEENIEIEVKEDTTITISAIGDIMCHNTQYKDAYNSDGTYDFSYVFEDIKQYIEPADLAIGNLETTLTGEDAGYSGYPTFNTPESLATDLKELGIDVLSTANNHSLDRGIKGIKNTIKELDEVGILHTGTYNSEEQEKMIITEVKGMKIGIISYTYGTNGIPVPKGHDYCINLIDDEKIKEDLKNIKEKNVDLTIAIMHWGQEYQQKPDQEQERLAKLLVENGVDIILGSHPHVLQKMDKIAKEDEKEAFVIYSLGNFISGQNKEPRKQSIVLNLKVTKNGKTGEISVDSAQYTPIYMDSNGTKKRYKLIDIETAISKHESGEKNITADLYNRLKNSYKAITTTVGNEY